MSEITKKAAPTYWSMVQAVVWIVSRDESLAIAVAPARSFLDFDGRRSSLLGGAALIPYAPPGTFPISLDFARAALVEAASTDKVHIHGQKSGTSPKKRIPVRPSYQIHDYCGVPALGPRSRELDSHFRGTSYWSNLSVSADECIAYWEGKAPAVSPSASLSDAAPVLDPRKPAGRPREWDWDGAFAHLIAIANTLGLPDKQADIERMITAYLSSKHPEGHEPTESAVREKAALIMRGRHNMGKPTGLK